MLNLYVAAWVDAKLLGTTCCFISGTIASVVADVSAQGNAALTV